MDDTLATRTDRERALIVDAPITRRLAVGDYVYLELDCPELARRATPGQFVNVRCEGVMLRRPFSIYRPVQGPNGAPTGVSIMFKVIGPGTRYMACRREGESLNLLGPLGRGLADLDLVGDNVLLLGGGYGVAPLDFCGRALRRAGRTVTLAMGTNALSLLPLYDGGSLQDWFVARSFAEMGIPFHVASLGGEPGVFAGTVVDLMETLLDGRPDVLACGSHPMMRASALAAQRHGLRCHVLMEELMGCGVSVCRSCVCRVRERTPDGEERIVNKTACTDGPLLDAANIVW